MEKQKKRALKRNFTYVLVKYHLKIVLIFKKKEEMTNVFKSFDDWTPSL